MHICRGFGRSFEPFDLGFPRLRPDYEADPQNEHPQNERCVNFHFSDPVFYILVRLYTKADTAFEFDADVLGTTLCRPSEYFTHDLDSADRQWLANELVPLVQAESPDACFQLLMAGDVDAVTVTVNELLGAAKIKEMGVSSKVEPLTRPVSSQSLHVIISKRRWRGTTNLYRFNAGLEKLKQTARYDENVSRLLDVFWERASSGPA